MQLLSTSLKLNYIQDDINIPRPRLDLDQKLITLKGKLENDCNTNQLYNNLVNIFARKEKYV